MGIMEAIADLRDELEAGTEVEKAVAYVAREYGFKPEVIAIRFERAYGSRPEAYVAPKRVDMASIVQEKIEAEAKKWRLSEHSQAALGTKFFVSGEWWHFIAHSSKGVHAVRADTAKVWVFSGSWVRDILAQVGKKVAA